jgi:hypothetical protein
MGYDIIGDIHGQFEKLESLLTRLGYRQRQGAWRHPERSAIFVGDFIDRGSRGVETVQTVRAMVDAGSALAVMGNHELNAIAWHTPDSRNPGEYLRPRSREPWGAKNRSQHKDFLAQVERDPVLHADLVGWFMSLPLWLDLEGLRVVHACWHAPFIDWLKPQLRDGRFLTPELLVDATTEPEDPAEKDTAAPSVFKAVEALTKGLEMPIPASHHFLDKDGHQRDRVRVRWWDVSGTRLRDLAFLSDSERQSLPDLPAPEHVRLGVAGDKPIFFGHYWMTDEPELQSDLAACVDYSAGKGGPLVAYRWDQGAPLTAAQFVSSS